MICVYCVINIEKLADGYMKSCRYLRDGGDIGIRCATLPLRNGLHGNTEHICKLFLRISAFISVDIYVCSNISH